MSLFHQIETSLDPQELLSKLKSIEATLGRTKSGVRNGPRVIDLDILFFDSISFESDSTTVAEDRTLQIPHKSIAEREFVLRPLVECVPSPFAKLDSSLPHSYFL